MSEVQPFTPALELIRHFLLGVPTLHPVAVDLLKLAGFAIVFALIGAVALRAAVRHCLRRGTITEY